jgi:anaerobilin synthase
MFQLNILPNESLIKFDHQLPIFNWSYPFDNDEDNITARDRPYTANQSSAVRRRGVYIHIPFCQTICNFCPFRREKYRSESEVLEYINALRIEMDLKRDYLGRFKVDTLSVGGGTPSLLSPHQIELLGESIHRCFDLNNFTEFTFEIEVKSLSQAKLNAMRGIGVNRVSFGAQTFSERMRTLFSLDASQTQIINTSELLRLMFPYTNVDLLYGLPGQDLEALRTDINAAIGLGTTTMDVYPINNLWAQQAMHTAVAKAGLSHLPEAKRVEFRIYLDQLLRGRGYSAISGYSYSAASSPSPNVIVQHFPKFLYHDLFYGHHDDDEIIGYGSSATSRMIGFNLYNFPSRQAYVRELLSRRGLPHLTFGPLAAPERGIVYFPYRGILEKARVPWIHIPEETLLALSQAINAGLIVEFEDRYELTKSGWLFYVNLMYYLMPTRSKAWISGKIEQRRRSGRTHGDTDLTQLIRSGISI